MWISLKTLARIAGISERVARKAAASALSRGAKWRGAQLNMRHVPGVGGAASQRYEVLLSSLPVDLQAKWHSQQPHAELHELVAERAARIEDERRAGQRKNRERFNNEPWTQEEREARHAAFSRLKTPKQVEAKRRLEVVQLFRSFDASDVSILKRYAVAARKADVATSTLRNWVGKCENLDPGDWLVALAPEHKGWAREVEISPAAYAWLKVEYFKLTKPSLLPIFRRAERMAQAQSWTLPSYHTVKRRIQAEPHWFHALMREGKEAFEALYPRQQRDYSTLQLHEIWCCDGRKADVFCRLPDGTITRPIVIPWMDVRSRLVIAYEIAPTESADGIRLAFKAAAEKSHAIPEFALLDNSRAFASKLLTGGAPNRFRFKVKEEDIPGILTIMGIKVIWALPFSGRSKPIESFFRQFAEAEKRFDGAYCGNRPEARPEDCDPAKAVPIEQYRKLLEETLAEYHTRPHRGDAMEGRSPRAVYEALLPQCAPRRPTVEQLRSCLLAAERLKLAPDDGAVRLLENRYWCEPLSELPRDRDYVVRFNPEDATEPVAIYDGERFICEAPLKDRSGFRSQEAARAEALGRKQFRKARRDQAAAHQKMSKARAWMMPPGVPDPLQAEVAEAVLPTPKVVTLLRTERNHRPEKFEKPIIPGDQILEIVFNHKRRAGEG